MTRIRILAVALAVASLVAAGSVLASTIVGTKRADTLRGTAKADNLFGQAGNDTLIGLGGKDLLVGGAGDDRVLGGTGADRLFAGPGADRLLCGPGKDTALADERDMVAKDCEVVHGLGEPPPSLSQPAIPGRYCGLTSQSRLVCFDVVEAATRAQTVANVHFTVQTTCEPSRQLDFTRDIKAVVPIRTDRAFSSFVSRSTLNATIDGRFDVVGTTAVGRLTAHVATERSGIHYECDSGEVSWKVRTPPPEVTARPGTFCGFTDQGRGLCFDVAGDPKTVTKLRLAVLTQCMPKLTFRRSSRILSAFAIAHDGTFSFTQAVSGTTGSGAPFRITYTMQGGFDDSGVSATGTLAAHATYESPGGQHYECDAERFNWSAKVQ